MRYEVRLTVHKNGTQNPDFKEVHDRMAEIGYHRRFASGGHLLSELHGMYHNTLSSRNIDEEQATIEHALQSIGFSFSIELFQITAMRTFNLTPAPSYSSLFGGLSVPSSSDVEDVKGGALGRSLFR